MKHPLVAMPPLPFPLIWSYLPLHLPLISFPLGLALTASHCVHLLLVLKLPLFPLWVVILLVLLLLSQSDRRLPAGGVRVQLFRPGELLGLAEELLEWELLRLPGVEVIARLAQQDPLQRNLFVGVAEEELFAVLG